MLLLAGPVLWISHFFAVYLFTEAVCPADNSVRVVTLVATVLTLGLIALMGLRTRRQLNATSTDDLDWRPIYLVGLGLAALSFVATLMVGIPAVFLDPC